MSFRDKPRVERLHTILRHASMQGLGALQLDDVQALEETHSALVKELGVARSYVRYCLDEATHEARRLTNPGDLERIDAALKKAEAP